MFYRGAPLSPLTTIGGAGITDGATLELKSGSGGGAGGYNAGSARPSEQPIVVYVQQHTGTSIGMTAFPSEQISALIQRCAEKVGGNGQDYILVVLRAGVEKRLVPTTTLAENGIKENEVLHLRVHAKAG